MGARSAILVAVLLRPLPLLAVENGSAGVAPFAAPSIGSGALWETLLFLLLIIGLIVGLGWLLRRMGHNAIGGKGMVRVLGGVSLGTRERAVVVQAGDTRLLVGVAPGRVEMLCMLDGSSGDELAANGKEFAQELESAVEDGVT